VSGDTASGGSVGAPGQIGDKVRRLECLAASTRVRMAGAASAELPERAGSQPVYDLSVSESHNFIANGVVVHNSSWG